MVAITRRNLVAAAPAIGLAAILANGGASAKAASPPADIYRVDDEQTILAAARAILAEDFVATLITLDADGLPRARSVGVWAPDDDFTLWMGTRRTSRKVAQIRTNPKATLHFARDDIDGNFANAYYASFMGTASVHIDDATLAARAPAEEHRMQWPNFPHDYAAIRFKTEWLEVTGRGIKGDVANWQPQAVIL